MKDHSLCAVFVDSSRKVDSVLLCDSLPVLLVPRNKDSQIWSFGGCVHSVGHDSPIRP